MWIILANKSKYVTPPPSKKVIPSPHAKRFSSYNTSKDHVHIKHFSFYIAYAGCLLQKNSSPAFPNHTFRVSLARKHGFLARDGIRKRERDNSNVYKKFSCIPVFCGSEFPVSSSSCSVSNETSSVLARVMFTCSNHLASRNSCNTTSKKCNSIRLVILARAVF